MTAMSSGMRNPVIQRIIHGAHCQRIVEAEHPIRSLLQTQELAHGFRTALFRSHISLSFGDDVVINDFKTGLHQCAFVSFHATNAGTGFRATNVRDSFAADVDQVPGCKHSDRFVIHSDEICRKARQASIDQNVWSLLLFNSEEEIHG